MYSKIKVFTIMALSLLTVLACSDDDPIMEPEYDGTPLVLNYGNLPTPDLPADNMLTVQGVELGRMLFYEKLLSKDGTQACASCHRQPDGFSDTMQFSIGVEKMLGKRQAMPVFNMAWHGNEFFWDGRAHLLRDQALLPIQDPLEMNETLDNVVLKLSESKLYRDQFIRAFGSEEVNPLKVSLALEQFMLSIVSHESKYDEFLAGNVTLSDSEERGRLLFETEFNPFFPDQSGADCAHCHGGANFENDQYMNNGLDSDMNINDIGREAVTKKPEDKAKFKVPSLRNVELTPPYMHDGRFETLEEVVEHYDLHVKKSMTLDPALVQVVDNGGLSLSSQDKVDLVNFLKTLTDPSLARNADYSDPF